MCWYEAPDAESARLALRQAGADLRVLWPATVHTGAGGTLPRVLVERRFPEPVTFDALQAREQAGAQCLVLNQVAFVRTFFSLDRHRMICLYHAPDAEAVRRTQNQLGMPWERVWACTPVPNTASGC